MKKTLVFIWRLVGIVFGLIVLVALISAVFGGLVIQFLD